MPFMARNYWIGDSHLRKKHHLPAAFDTRVRENSDFHRFWGVRETITLYHLDKKFEDEVKEVMGDAPEGPKLVTISVGSNDIRDKPSSRQVDRLMIRFATVVRELLSHEQTVVVLMSPIPDNEGYTNKYGEMLNERLKTFVRGIDSDRLRFCNFREKCLALNCDDSRWDPDLFSDDKHLNAAGAERLADEYVKVLGTIPNRAFGKGPVRGKDRDKMAAFHKRHDKYPVYANDAREVLSGRRRRGWVNPRH
jgi:hypothetical protein